MEGNVARPRAALSEGRVSLRKKGRYWCARWTEGKRQPEVSLRVTNRDVAKKLARQINDALEKGEPWEWVLGRTRAGERTFSEVVDEYLDRGSSWSATTRKSNKSTVELLLREFGDQPVTQIDRNAIEGYLARRRDEGLSKASRNRYLCALKVILGKAEEWGYVRENVAGAIKTEPEGRKLPHPYHEDELERLLGVLQYEHRRIAEVYLHTAMRRGELMNLLWSDVDLVAHTITVRGPKNRRDRTIPMSTRVWEILSERTREWEAERRQQDVVEARVFGERANIRQVIRRAMRRAEIPLVRRQAIRPLHSLRDTSITRLVAAGVPLDRVQVLAGHTTMDMTRRYAETREASLREAVTAVFG